MDSEPRKTKPWKLHIGCHKMTLASRDSGVREHDSLEACKKDVEESERFWASLGYYVWFAIAKGPDGEEIKLHEGTSYC